MFGCLMKAIFFQEYPHAHLVYLHGDMGISLFNEPQTEGATYVKPW